MKNKIDTNKILARVSLLMDYPYSNIRLKENKNNQNNIQFSNTGKHIDINYTEAGSLAHELSHACFTPSFLYNRTDNNNKSLLNCIEDNRIEKAMQKSDKYIYRLIEEQQSKLDYSRFNKLPEEEKNLCYLAIGDKFKDKIKIKPEIKKQIDNALKIINKNPLDYHTSIKTYEKIRHLFVQDKNDEYNIEQLKEYEQNHWGINSILEEAKNNEEAMPLNLEQTLKEIKRDLIDRKFNTCKGKLNTKRIGILPNQTIFQKIEKRKNEQHLFILYDVSGSMNGYPINNVIEFNKAIKQAENSKLQVTYIAFSSIAMEYTLLQKSDFRYINSETGGGTDIQAGLEFILNKINKNERNTVILVTDGCSDKIEPETVKRLQELSNVVCILISNYGDQIEEAGFNNLFKVNNTIEIPLRLKEALIKGK